MHNCLLFFQYIQYIDSETKCNIISFKVSAHKCKYCNLGLRGTILIGQPFKAGPPSYPEIIGEDPSLSEDNWGGADKSPIISWVPSQI